MGDELGQSCNFLAQPAQLCVIRALAGEGGYHGSGGRDVQDAVCYLCKLCERQCTGCGQCNSHMMWEPLYEQLFEDSRVSCGSFFTKEEQKVTEKLSWAAVAEFLGGKHLLHAVFFR